MFLSILTSTFGCAFPTEPGLSKLLPGICVVIAQFSVIPYPTVMLTPIFLNQFLWETCMAAAPETTTLALLNPNFFFKTFLIRLETIGIDNRKSSFF